MSTDMSGIFQRSLFEKTIQLPIIVGENSRYRVLSNILPWPEMANLANNYRGKKVDIHNGRTLNMRLHLGAYVAQSMNGWTDRQTEEMIKYHAGVKVLCGLEGSIQTADRTRIEGFRSMLGKEGAEALNQLIVKHAAGAGFTGSELCAADTTVQESPIAYPTEVGHMKNMADKLFGIGKRLKGKVDEGLKKLHDKATGLFRTIRLFCRGKSEEVLERKKELSEKLHRKVRTMIGKVKTQSQGLKKASQKQVEKHLSQFQHILDQIKIWLKTGHHPKDKILSLWESTARAISKGKTGKKTEFGVRWLIIRLAGGYVIGAPCQKLGADADTSIADEVLMTHLNTFGEIPTTFVYDRGADSKKHDQFLQQIGVENNCIFPKGKKKMKVTAEVLDMARTERSLNEAAIANIKNPKYNFTKPRAKSTTSCVLKGHLSMLGFNLNHLVQDTVQTWAIAPEIT